MYNFKSNKNKDIYERLFINDKYSIVIENNIKKYFNKIVSDLKK